MNKNKTIEIFKKTSSLRQLPITFEEFCEALDKIGIELNNEKIASIKKRIKEINKIVKEQSLVSPQKQQEIENQKQKEEAEKIAKEKADKKAEKTEAEGEGEGEEDEQSEEEGKTNTERRKSVTAKSSKSGAPSEDEDSGSESKSKTTHKTSKTGKTGKTDKTKTEKTSKTGESGSEDEDEDESESSPLRTMSVKSKNKSVRFSTIGGSKNKTEIHTNSIDRRRMSLKLIPEEGLEFEQKAKLKVHPIFIEKERLEMELQKYTSKTVEDCHDDIMNIIECHDPQKFRRKVKGVLVVPFDMKNYERYHPEIAKGEKKKTRQYFTNLQLKNGLPGHVFSVNLGSEFKPSAKHEKRTKLNAAEIKAKVEEMKIRREHEKLLRERQTEKAKRNMEEKQKKELARKVRMKMNTASKQRKVYVDGHSQFDDGTTSVAPSVKLPLDESPTGRGSYRVRKNLSKGLDPNEGKNTKVTLELLQKLHYKDIEQALPDDFKPEKFVTEPEDNDDDDSVFDYFFPGNKKKKPKNVKGDNYSEKILNIKKELSQNPARGGNEVGFEDKESTYRSDKGSAKPVKSQRSIQPSNPAQSKKMHRRVESQVLLHPKGGKGLILNTKNLSPAKGAKAGKLNALVPSSSKKFAGAQTSRAGPSDKQKSVGRSKSRDKPSKLKESNQKSHILNKIAKIEDMRKREEKNSMNRAIKIHNNQLRKSQKYLK